jgi:hypothetical protein
LKATESPFGCCCLPTWCSTIMHISLAAIALVLAPFVSSALGFTHFQRSRATFAPTLPEAPSVFLASQSAESATGNEVDLENEDDEDHRLNGASSPASLDPTSIHRDTSPWSQDESARQLTEYMAKAHEEKLRAIRLVEDKYRAEIAELRGRLEKTRARRAPPLRRRRQGTAGTRSSFRPPTRK